MILAHRPQALGKCKAGGLGIEFRSRRKGREVTKMGTMSDTRNMCQEQADATAASLDELWERINVSEDDYWAQESPRDAEEARQALEDYPLEIVWEKGEPFAVVLGTGGPHVEIRGGGRHDGMGYTLHVYWGGEHVVRYGSESSGIARTGRYFREMVEESE